MTPCVCRVEVIRDPITFMSHSRRTPHPECPLHAVPKPGPRA